MNVWVYNNLGIITYNVFNEAFINDELYAFNKHSIAINEHWTIYLHSSIQLKCLMVPKNYHGLFYLGPYQKGIFTHWHKKYDNIDMNSLKKIILL